MAIIMDGNGRWAKARGWDRSMGHQQGVESVRRITSEASRLGIKFLTLYTENWNRPAAEVAALMGLILNSLEEELFMKNNVRLRIVGDMTRLPKEVLAGIATLQEHTAQNSGMTLILALSYSSRWEITQAARRIAKRVDGGQIRVDEITEDTIQEELSTAFAPDPDLLIRTGGEIRLSNYLLWQCAYSELYFCDTFWPDFDEKELHKAIAEYQHRERRFGKTSEQIQSTEEIQK